ncbi:MAG: hypothetical protein JRJ86_03835 [Deltaproteobacteria bacterium]|nr:hypothetical protein [Deltaproteobacteria bacterium]MBW2117392.1 hypothetical protein [Deltaproteobacteria bacterium]MBW2343722.1 hypothetical protein [Deltaproteobacteria bacterium]
MHESTTITISKTMPVTERIPGVSRQILEWLESLEEPFNIERDALHLAKYERNIRDYRYHYVLDRDIKIPRKR